MLLLSKVKDELLVINVLTILLMLIIIFAPLEILRPILGLPVALFFPGYTLLAALFPRKRDFNAMERVALSFGLSITVVALLGLILNYTPWGVRLYPVLISTTLFVVTTSVAAFFRRGKLSSGERFGVSFRFRLTKWREASLMDKSLSIGLILAILVAVGTLGYAIATQEQSGESFTQFYVLDVEGKAEGYPEELAVGEETRVKMGIVNHEHKNLSYLVEVVVGGRTNEKIGPVALAHQEKWEGEISFIPVKKGGNQKVELLLYKYGEVKPYRQLYLWVNVKQ